MAFLSGGIVHSRALARKREYHSLAHSLTLWAEAQERVRAAGAMKLSLTFISSSSSHLFMTPRFWAV